MCMYYSINYKILYLYIFFEDSILSMQMWFIIREEM